jgi:DNA-binding CsgD family transcriptional regulator
MLPTRAVTVVMRSKSATLANRMTPPKLPILPKTNFQRNQAHGKDSPPPPLERIRLLFFGCSPADAQKMLLQGGHAEIAFLPSYDANEILEEISRYSPRLIACGSEFFIQVMKSTSDSRLTNTDHGTTVDVPKKASVSPISRREARVLSMLVRGNTNNEIANELKLSSRTVKRTLSNLFERFAVSNRTELSNLVGRLLSQETGAR